MKYSFNPEYPYRFYFNSLILWTIYAIIKDKLSKEGIEDEFSNRVGPFGKKDMEARG